MRILEKVPGMTLNRRICNGWGRFVFSPTDERFYRVQDQHRWGGELVGEDGEVLIISWTRDPDEICLIRTDDRLSGAMLSNPKLATIASRQPVEPPINPNSPTLEKDLLEAIAMARPSGG